MSEIRVFLHLAKCGGTTVSEMFRRAYRRETHFVDPTNYLEDYPSVPVRPEARFAAGHGRVAYFDQICVDRTVRFATIMRHPVDRVWSRYRAAKWAAVRAGGDPRELLRRMLGSHSNRYVRDIGGVEVLRERFDVVGITERFEEFVVALERAWEIELPRIEPQNTNNLAQEITEEERRLIAEANAADLEFYELVKEGLP